MASGTALLCFEASTVCLQPLLRPAEHESALFAVLNPESHQLLNSLEAVLSCSGREHLTHDHVLERLDNHSMNDDEQACCSN